MNSIYNNGSLLLLQKVLCALQLLTYEWHLDICRHLVVIHAQDNFKTNSSKKLLTPIPSYMHPI